MNAHRTEGLTQEFTTRTKMYEPYQGLYLDQQEGAFGTHKSGKSVSFWILVLATPFSESELVVLQHSRLQKSEIGKLLQELV